MEDFVLRRTLTWAMRDAWVDDRSHDAPGGSVKRSTLAVVETLLPSGAHPLLGRGVLDAGFETFMEEFEATAPPRLRLGFRAGVAAATWVAPMLIGRIPPLMLHGRSTRERALEAMSRPYLLRQLLIALKLVVAFCYGADPEVRVALGYPPPGRFS
jgi:hypothetical protein